MSDHPMRPYTPSELPLTDLDFRRLLPLVGQANAALARYDGLLQELQPGSGQRWATLCFPRLINLAEGKDVL